MTHQQERKRAIRAFMQAHYTDEKLAQLLAHAQDGKLDYSSCCCFIGVATANHTLGTGDDFGSDRGGMGHYIEAKRLSGAALAEKAFAYLWESNYWDSKNRECRTLRQRRNAILIPMIRAEQKRRSLLRASQDYEVQEAVEVSR